MTERDPRAPVFGLRKGRKVRSIVLPRGALATVGDAIGWDKSLQAERAVYLALWHTRAFHPGGVFIPNMAELTSFTGFGLRRVKQALNRLDDAGVIVWDGLRGVLYIPDAREQNVLSPCVAQNVHAHLSSLPPCEALTRCISDLGADTLPPTPSPPGVGGGTADRRQKTVDSRQQTGDPLPPAAAADDAHGLRALASELGKRHGIGDVQRWGHEGEAVGELGIEDVRAVVTWQAERTASDSKQGGRWGALFKPGGCWPVVVREWRESKGNANEDPWDILFRQQQERERSTISTPEQAEAYAKRHPQGHLPDGWRWNNAGTKAVRL